MNPINSLLSSSLSDQAIDWETALFKSRMLETSTFYTELAKAYTNIVQTSIDGIEIPLGSLSDIKVYSSSKLEMDDGMAYHISARKKYSDFQNDPPVDTLPPMSDEVFQTDKEAAWKVEVEYLCEQLNIPHNQENINILTAWFKQLPWILK